MESPPTMPLSGAGDAEGEETSREEPSSGRLGRLCKGGGSVPGEVSVGGWKPTRGHPLPSHDCNGASDREDLGARSVERGHEGCA